MQTETSLSDPFSEYADILEEIGATTTEATDRMWTLYEEAITSYTAESILNIFHLNLVANLKKYAELIEFYEEKFYPFGDYYRNETYDHQRTPDLTSASTSTGTGSADSARNQTRTTTNTPGVTTTTTHSVNPFDNTGLKQESQDVTGETGYGTISEAYTGDPDHTTTSSSASSSVSTTGTDRNEYSKIIHGRDGRRPTSEVVADGLLAAALHDILDIIINDIADQIFLQVWI